MTLEETLSKRRPEILEIPAPTNAAQLLFPKTSRRFSKITKSVFSQNRPEISLISLVKTISLLYCLEQTYVV